jgi:GNAT superfamily N-acetyltransferase
VARNDLLAAYDAQLRAHVPPRLPGGVVVERDGPLVRFVGFAGGGFIGYRDLDGLSDDDVDELIARQVELFRARGEPFEWKHHGHDRPADLPERLTRTGFVAEETETVVIAPLDADALRAEPPPGVTLRQVRERFDLGRIGAMEQAVWDEDASAIVDDLERELAADPDGLIVVVAEAGEDVVSAAWVRFPAGTEFGTLWGGATLPEWRGRGIYRALVAHRARLAAERGCRYLEVDASDDSRPILERLGFVPLTTTTPYVWSPDSRRGS